MKKPILLCVLGLAFMSVNVDAQCYSLNKLKYDPRLYVMEWGDPYNPALSGVCSFLIPGLGQVVAGETGRGLAFFGGYVGCAIVMEVGVAQLAYSVNNYEYGTYGGSPGAGVGTMLIGAGGMLAVSIWSIVDAVNVAKVNNMYIRDMRKTSSLKLELAPYVTQISINNKLTTPVGMTMRVTF